MKHSLLLLSVFSLLNNSLSAQDTVYARQVIAYLSSEPCFGRGYVRQGLQKAEQFIVSELKQAKTLPLFGESYTQPFLHPVNTFPKNCRVKINGRRLRTGYDFIPDPAACSAKGAYRLRKIDSTHYISTGASPEIRITLKNKLTYSVARSPEDFCGLQLDRNRVREEPLRIRLNIRNKHLPEFESRNIGCVMEGRSASDSVIVFSAHYDHLGGIGKSTFFPGANDNASGVSVLLNLIRHYRAHPPAYKTVFLFFAGEEAGLVGSRFFVEHPAFDLKKIKFLLNLDLLGTGDDGIMVVNGAIHEALFDRLNTINSEQHLVKEIRKRGKAANSDHYWFTEKGVPAFFIYTMGGNTAYHDVYDVAKSLPLSDYVDVFRLITRFIETF